MDKSEYPRGYMIIGNDLFEAIVLRLSNPVQLRLVLWLIRLTIGFRRSETKTNYNALASKLNINKDLVLAEIAVLEKQKVLTIAHTSAEVAIIKVNKVDKWASL